MKGRAVEKSHKAPLNLVENDDFVEADDTSVVAIISSACWKSETWQNELSASRSATALSDFLRSLAHLANWSWDEVAANSAFKVKIEVFNALTCFELAEFPANIREIE